MRAGRVAAAAAGGFTASPDLLITPERLRRLADPSVQPWAMRDDRGTVNWRPIPGPLWGPAGPRPRDEAQGGAGDCWLLSDIAEIAAVHQQRLLENMIRDNQDGTFTVRFFGIRTPQGIMLPSLDGNLPPGQAVPIDVTVDRLLPFRDGRLVYANRSGSRFIWPEIVEKAAAKLYGTYEQIGQGGELATSIFLTTGWRAQVIDPKQYDLETLFQMFERTIGSGGVALGGTPAQEPVGWRWMVTGHAEGFRNPVRHMNGMRTVQARNPWGQNPAPNVPPFRWDINGEFPIAMIGVQRGFNEIAFAVPGGRGAPL